MEGKGNHGDGGGSGLSSIEWLGKEKCIGDLPPQ
jgi:hypothetical protein